MKEISSDRDSLFNRRKIQALEQQSHKVAEQVRQMQADLDELERLYSSSPLDKTSSSQQRQGRSESEMQEQPWGHYIFLIVLTLLLIGLNVGL